MDIILGYFFLVVLLQHRSLGQSCLRRKYVKAGPFLTPPPPPTYALPILVT